MPSSGPTAPKSLAAKVAALKDAELDRYLEERRRPDGTRVVDVDGWDNLPKDQRDNLMQRLR